MLKLEKLAKMQIFEGIFAFFTFFYFLKVKTEPKARIINHFVLGIPETSYIQKTTKFMHKNAIP
jgi:hypothetical protein